MMARQLPRRTCEALAACEAVGLMFWADHPRAGHAWAVDDHQRVHVVRIGRSASTAQHVCQASFEAEPCAGYTELEEGADRDVDRLNTR
jgi:hypothetical protein